ncbi:methyl-accepting chemotaxis protein [Marinobacter shengliensis]|uniref:methyl-accepting chemotaxis protein n=1 Tax=Marinobacter shengliensis TaxID=1389223 RepID=UPI000D0FF256|nr:methyl-accepting chemotaxis protein [Marinobacter shengliensis]PSF11633.1 methyl-accepting chemotaxis protein [Marinobacter shengliensis]
MKDFFINLSIRWKLTVGFGLLLALISALSGVSIYSLEYLIKENEKVESVSAIDDYLSQARFNEKNFLIRADQKYIDDAKLAINKGLESARNNYETSQSASRRSQLEEVITSIQNYERDLDGTVEQIQERETVQQQMEQSARLAVSELRNLETQLRRAANRQIDLSGDRDLINASQAAERASALAFEILEARNDEKNYLLTQNNDYVNTVISRIDAVEDELGALSGEVLGAASDQITSVETVLVNYREQLQRLVRNTERMNSSEAQMTLNARRTTDAAMNVYVEQQQAMVDREKQVVNQLIVATIVAFILGIVSMLVITRVIVKPLDQVVSAANRVAEGDLTTDLTTHRRDEIGKVMKAMQAMTVNLRRIVQELADGIAQIASASEELSAVTEQTSAGAAQQRDETDQAATAMQEMTATVQDVARNAESAADSAGMADRHAREGFEVVRDTVRKIEALSDEVEESARDINKLRAESANIGTVLDVIKSIAEQTNLLALNAAIEAARAGEQGRGFAVVADEVRSLAQRTQDSTVEIETLVNSLQNGAENAVTSMTRNSESAEATVTAARVAGEALKTINDAVSNIQEMNQQIATAVEEQTSVAEGISEGMVTIREVTDQSATATNQISASSNELAKLGGDLQRLVDRFKIGARQSEQIKAGALEQAY